MATLVLYAEELDRLAPRGFTGQKLHKKAFIYGEKQDVRNFKKQDSYRDLAVRKTIKSAIRRGHDKPEIEDFKSFTRESKGKLNIIYALDSSGSMKGKKIEGNLGIISTRVREVPAGLDIGGVIYISKWLFNIPTPELAEDAIKKGYRVQMRDRRL